MRRIFTETIEPQEGAVYRNIGNCQTLIPEGSSSAEECGECIDTTPVGVITPPGCSEFPVTDNDYGNLPTFYAGDVEIDTFGYDDRWDAIDNPFTPVDPTCPVPPQNLPYPDLWTRTGNIGAGLQDDVLLDDCYCLGEGIDKPSLTIGRPQFPRIAPLPFFAFPNFQGSFISVREFNPDGPLLDGDCCPGEDDIPEHIFAEFVGNELRLTRRKKPDIKEQYRADDTDQSFQLIAGYPQECCMLDDCAPSGEEEYVERMLHFPRWPGPNSLTYNIDACDAILSRATRNPYEEDPVDREEPLGIIPVVVDIQCHDDGKLYVYYANIVVHDGIISGIQWNVKPPRSEALFRAGNLPPISPEDLDVNRDYQDEPVWAVLVGGDPPSRVEDFDPIVDPNLEKPWCVETCLQAAIEINKEDEACAPACPAENIFCEDPESQVISEGFGATPEAAGNAAFQQALEVDTALFCIEEANIGIYWLCYTVFDEDTQQYKAAVTFCCELKP